MKIILPLQVPRWFLAVVSSEISEQPLTLAETIQGAKNRAKNALVSCEECTYSIGPESGLFEAPGSHTGWLEATASAIYDGTDFHIGLSCGFEAPPSVLELVLDDKMDLSQACQAAEICDSPKIGAAEGLIGILTKGRLTRKDYTKQSLIIALIQIENVGWDASSTSVDVACHLSSRPAFN